MNANGWVTAGYESVAEAFQANFDVRGEAGAAFAVTVDGRLVVDLWGGTADVAVGRSWLENTIVPVFSGTKGLTALCLLMLVDRGQLALDEPVSKYWPEFAANGKERITVAQLVSHRARLPVVDAELSESDVLEPERMATLLAAQAPERDPRAALIYHSLTYGWLCGELISRIDGRRIGDFFAEEVAAPLQLELWIGLPDAQAPRVATLHYGPDWGKGTISDAEPAAGDELQRKMWFNPPLFPPERMLWNERAWRRAELAGSSAIGTARSMARLYGCLARGGELDGVRLLSSDMIALGRTRLSEGTDPLTGEPLAFGVGFALQTPARPFGPPALAFGHGGAGGSIHGAWPEHAVGFSYAMNELRDEPGSDGRAAPLLDALRRAVVAAA